MDNFKIIYKMLRQLEKNMGNEEFSMNSISCESLGIEFNRWEQLLIMMQDEGYIKGLILTSPMESKFRHIAEPIKPEITLKGLEYLAENSFMAKAKDALRLVGEII